MCLLDLPDPKDSAADPNEPFADQAETILMYQASQGHDFAAVVTNKQSIYVYSLVEMRAKFFAKQRRQEKSNLDLIRDHQDPLNIDTEQSHDA